MAVTIRQLRAFALLARTESFTSAATAIHVTQPALSSQIKELESTLGVRLFDRSTRRVVPTSSARELLPVVDQVLGNIDDLVTRAKGVAAQEIGRVSVAALPSLAATLVPEVIGRYRRAHPGVVITMVDALAADISRQVHDGSVDFGLTGAVSGDPKLHFDRIGTEPMVAVMKSSHPLSRARRLTLSQVLSTPLILMNRDSSVRLIIDRAAAANGNFVSPVFETAFMSTAVSLVRSGLGLTLLPASAIALSDMRGLVLMKVRDKSLERQLGILRRAGHSMSPAAESFLSDIRIALLAWMQAQRRGGGPIEAGHLAASPKEGN